MAFVRPTLAQLITRIQADFVSRLALVGAVLRRSIVYVLARVLAGAAHLLHGHLEYLGKQLFPDLSDEDYLVRQASVFNLTKNAPSFAFATALVTGTTGAVVLAKTLLRRADGAEYTVTADATLTAGSATLQIKAVLAGASGTVTPGVSLAFESPVTGVSSASVVDASTADGVDREGTEPFRVRFLEFLAARGDHGGNVADYERWSKGVAGVTRVWVYPSGLGPGTVLIRYVRDMDPSPIPDVGEVAALQSVLDALKPAHASVTVFAPTAAFLDVTCHLTPSTPETRAAVRAELAAMLARRALPGSTILLSWVQTAIGVAAGVDSFTLASPVADTLYSANQLPFLGMVTFT